EVAVDLHYTVELLFRKIQAPPVEVLVPRHPAQGCLKALRTSARTLDHPFQDAHIFAKTGPKELAVLVLAEPIDRKDRRRFGDLPAEIEPVREVIAHVITGERQHRKGIASD